ncbi:MAG: class I SAM-dependent methyltransferase [Pseudomonadota bacterium]|nr:class I SAM-dependent methyltransferase [Pseudomonadota bacterium]
MIKPEKFHLKVKQKVADNFDQSYQIYQDFEEKHHFFYELTVQLAKKIGLQSGSRVLDVGCGNGISALALHEQFSCQVMGLDLSDRMVADGQVLHVANQEVCLVLGDGERLTEIVGDQLYDYVLYNASIFIFPDVERSLREAAACLSPGGKIAFSFYPRLTNPAGDDLFAVAFQRLGEPLPRFRVITDYQKTSSALEQYCHHVCHHQWIRPFDLEFLRDFFSIPAQSASLFPGRNYKARRDLIGQLFASLEDVASQASIVWRMAEGTKA